MTKPKPLTDQEADRVAADLIIEHAWLKGEVRRMRAVLEQLAEYSHDCDHDVIARRALAEQK